MTTYLNPNAIEGYTAAQQGKFLAKGANGISFVDGGGGPEMTNFLVREVSDPYEIIDIGSDENREYLYTTLEGGGANLTFKIYGEKENYILIYSPSEDITISISALNHDFDSIHVIQPAEITCPADQYIELSIILVEMYGREYAVVSASSPLIVTDPQ